MKNETFDKARVISFSDAVFSIAITLLVLEVVIPSYKELKTGDTLLILRNRIPSFIGLVVSFMVTAIYWVSHLRIIKYVSSINSKLLWLNIMLLFFIVLLPFSTAFYVKGFSYNGPFAFYCFNLSAIGLFNVLMNFYIIKKEKGLTGISATLGKYYKLRALNGFLVWVIAGCLAFTLPMFSRFLFIFLFISEIFITKYFKKKLMKERNI
ncbi:TMEM175 family protein [Polaribacter sp. Asnod6-C07]|uniref:TMEM175 family protein n=1 Tax=Polaribacter sp. Asnod6-C07 TaxID=3160582 RepID=UPI00386AB1D4